MKAFTYFLLVCSCFLLISACGDDTEDEVIIGTLDNDIVNLNFSPTVLMTSFEEEFAEDYDFIDIDSIYFVISPMQNIVGEGTVRYTDDDGNIVSTHILTRVPFTLEESNLILTPDDMNRGESCSGNPCSQCKFEQNGAGCDCIGGGTCNHTITRFAHGKTEQGGFNNIYEC